MYNFLYHLFVYIYNLPIRKKDILPFVTTTWVDLEGIMLSEISQKTERQIL